MSSSVVQHDEHLIYTPFLKAFFYNFGQIFPEVPKNCIFTPNKIILCFCQLNYMHKSNIQGIGGFEGSKAENIVRENVKLYFKIL